MITRGVNYTRLGAATQPRATQTPFASTCVKCGGRIAPSTLHLLSEKATAIGREYIHTHLEGECLTAYTVKCTYDMTSKKLRILARTPESAVSEARTICEPAVRAALRYRAKQRRTEMTKEEMRDARNAIRYKHAQDRKDVGMGLRPIPTSYTVYDAAGTQLYQHSNLFTAKGKL